MYMNFDEKCSPNVLAYTTRKSLIFCILCTLLEQIPSGINQDILKIPTWCKAKNSTNSVHLSFGHLDSPHWYCKKCKCRGDSLKDNLYEKSKLLFSGKNKKNILIMPSVEFFTQNARQFAWMVQTFIFFFFFFLMGMVGCVRGGGDKKNILMCHLLKTIQHA